MNEKNVNSYFFGMLIGILAIILFTSIRGCVNYKLYNIKDGHYGYKGYVVIEGEPTRDVYVSNNGDGRIAVISGDGKEITIVITGNDLTK